MGLLITSCNRRQTAVPPQPSEPAASVSPPVTGVVTIEDTVAITLPVLHALLANEAFRTALLTKVGLTQQQVEALQRVAKEESERPSDANTTTPESAADARARADSAISGLAGDDKATQIIALAREFWVKGSEEKTEEEFVLLPGPNAVPSDTRVVVNIPAYRMDVFRDGELLKTYRIGIGYPRFPLPTGLRKAQTIIFNPTWTPPNEPWVASMKNVSAGQTVPAGSPLNPLGPIKIPIGMPSLIHGGKPPAKIGTFASHGCVGMTNSQVKDFARTLVQAAGKELSDATLATYLRDRTRTRSLKLDRPVPVELRYETIVVENGKLHIFRDVYDLNTNTEENLRLALEKSGINVADLSEEERTAIMEALNALSSRPKKMPPKVAPSPVASPQADEERKTSKQTKIAKNQKEVVIEVAALSGKGYPEPKAVEAVSAK